MTENEAIKRIREQACNDRFLAIHCDDSCLYGAEKCEWAHAIQALEKVQAFEAIGTIEEFKALKEKNEPKKAKWKFNNFTAKFGKPYHCSNCDEEFGDTYNYCPNCGCDMYAD